MKRESLILVMCLFMPGMVSALGLGKIELSSGLNQPFEAQIELLSATADELGSLQVGLADNKAFRRAGIDRPFVLSNLRFQVKETESGPDYIRVYSQDSIREPYLNFLIEAGWSKGRLFREYTVLLDPPLYDPYQRSTPVADTSAPVVEPVMETEYEVSDVEEVEETEIDSTPVMSSYSGEDYGPTESSDTLWSIAKQMRPDTSTSIQQMMMALLRTNPEAFLNNNINGLKRGLILRMPETDEISALSNQEALSEVKSQYAMWEQERGTIVADIPERPDTTSRDVAEPEDAVAATMAEEDDAELRLVGDKQDEISSESCYSSLGLMRGRVRSFQGDLLLGLLARTMGRLEGAGVHFSDALTFCRRGGYRPMLAWSLYEHARLLLSLEETKESEKATKLLIESLEISSDLGMAPLREKVIDLQGVLHGGPISTTANPDNLTEREVEVLNLVASGMTNRVIAQALFISTSTVERHISNIFNKTGSTNRADATRYAMRHGLTS